MGGAGLAAGQHQKVKVRLVQLGGQRIGLKAYAVGTAHRAAAADGGGGHLNTRPAQNIHHDKGFAFFQAVRKKYTGFAHVRSSFPFGGCAGRPNAPRRQ